MTLPHPLDELAGCCWLPRLTAKTRVYLRGELPFSFRIAFGSPVGVDGYFLRHFRLTRAQIITAVRAAPTAEEFGQWFLTQPAVTAQSIAAWNRLAPRLGAKGNPAYRTRQIAAWLFRSKSISHPVGSIFEMLIQDENLQLLTRPASAPAHKKTA